jgi:glucokinase
VPRIDTVLGVDIGGNDTVLGFVDTKGRVIVRTSIRTEAHQPAIVFFERLHEAAEALRERTDEECELLGIGIGAPNANFFKGTIESPPNLSWEFVDVVGETRKHFSVPVSVTNDANAAALGEMLFGAARGMRDFVVITLRKGLGSGIVANGELIYGADGFAGEIGHTIVDPSGRECGCGRRGCLETYASASGLCRTVQELICTSSEPSRLRGVDFLHLTSRMVFEVAERGDRLALEAFEKTGRILGMKLADSVAHTSPEAIILAGGLTAAGDLLFKPTKRSLEEHLLGVYKNKVKLLPSGLAEDTAAILGASALIWKSLGKVPRSRNFAANVTA